MRFVRILAVGAVATVAAGSVAAGAADGVDVALVLAVDVSKSVSPAEAELQRRGYADALESGEVLRAIRSGLLGRIAVTYVEWSSTRHQTVVVDWSIVEGPDSAAEIASRLRSGTPGSGMETSISSALSFSRQRLGELPWPAERRVIDVSGDGVNNYGAPLGPVRDQLVAEGVVINGLPIGPPPRKGPDVTAYYADQVIGGPGAFLVRAPTMGDFAAAVRTKIALEVAGLTPPVQYSLLRTEADDAENLLTP